MGKWDQMDYTRCNLVGSSPLHEQHLQEVGIPLHFAPEAPKLKKTWVKKEGHMGDFFKKRRNVKVQKWERCRGYMCTTRLPQLWIGAPTRIVCATRSIYIYIYWQTCQASCLF